MAIQKKINQESKDKKSRRRWGDITLYKETLTLPEGVTHVRDIELFDFSSLTLPEGVKKVGDIELYDRSSLTLSKGLTQVGGLYALSGGCSITFPDGYILKNSGRRRLQYSAKEMNRLLSEHQNVHKDVSFILSTKLPDVEIVRSNINHPDVDFVLLFVPEHGSFKSADKLPKLKAIRNMAGDSLIEISVPGVRYSVPEDPTYSDVKISEKGLKGIVEQFREKLPEEYIDGKPFGVAVFAPEDICGYKANLDSSWTQYSIGCEVFDSLKLSGLNISSMVSMFPGELFVNGFSFEAVEHGVPLTVSVGVKDLSTLKDESYGERFCPFCYLNHNTREVDFATSSDFVKVDFLELLSYGKGKTQSLKSSVKSNRKRKMSGIKM